VTTHGHILWVVWPSPKPRFHKRPGSFPGSYSTHSKQRDHPRPYTMGCLTITQTRVPQKTRKFSRQLFDLFETKWPPKAKYSWVVWPSQLYIKTGYLLSWYSRLSMRCPERVWSDFWYPPHSGYHLLETAVHCTGLTTFFR
jgi:hypothetical protein